MSEVPLYWRVRARVSWEVHMRPPAQEAQMGLRETARRDGERGGGQGVREREGGTK